MDAIGVGGESMNCFVKNKEFAKLFSEMEFLKFRISFVMTHFYFAVRIFFMVLWINR